MDGAASDRPSGHVPLADEYSTFVDREGRSLDVMQWARLMADFAGRIVRHDKVSDDVEVLTMFHGMDGDDPFRRPPHVYGTVIKQAGHVVHEVTTPGEDEALLAHEQLLDLAEELL